MQFEMLFMSQIKGENDPFLPNEEDKNNDSNIRFISKGATPFPPKDSYLWVNARVGKELLINARGLKSSSSD